LVGARLAQGELMPAQTHAIEDYLLAIYTLESEGHAVIGARLAEQLHVSPPAVTDALHRMDKEGLVKLTNQKVVHLTATGRGVAETMVRRHRLAERLMTDILGLDWADVHEEAHRFEHVISPKVEERLIALLGEPTTCPHGSPIPGSGARVNTSGIRLSDAAEGAQVELERVTESGETNRELLNLLGQHGLRPGSRLEVLHVAETLGTIQLRRDGDEVTLGLPAAAQIIVSPAR
jgi:DtxR family Mn-dependent transcriptional regulator